MNTLRWEKGVSLRALQDGGGLLAGVIDRYELAFYLVDDDVFVTSDVCTMCARVRSQVLHAHLTFSLFRQNSLKVLSMSDFQQRILRVVNRYAL